MPAKTEPGPLTQPVRRKPAIAARSSAVPACERAALRREREPFVVSAQVERLDAEPVAREHQPAARGVPEREREHASQRRDEVGALLLIEVDDHLGVAARAEAVALRLEPRAQPWWL